MDNARETAAIDRAARQAALYEFPYHWIPQLASGRWQIWRSLSWGYEYLAVLGVVMELALSEAPARVLDFGCGDGRLTHELLVAGVGEVVGVDVDPQAIAFAAAFNLAHGDRARFLCRRVESLDQGRFPVAVAMEVLEHVPDREIVSVVDALGERVADRGALVVSVPTTNIALNPKHERHYTFDTLIDQLEPHFSVEVVRYVHRVGLAARVIDGLTRNRFVYVSEPRLMRALSAAYARLVSVADETDGAHLVARLRRRDPAKTRG